MSMEDFLKAIMGGAAPQKKAQPQSKDPLSEMLKGILGGAGQQPGGSLEDILGGAGAQDAQGAGGLAGILGGILGGGGAQGAQGAGDLGGILGGILGGGGAGLSSNTFLAPIVEGLAKKLGLSPAIAQAVVSFGIAKLLPALLGGATATPAPRPTKRRTTRRRKKEPQGLDLDDLWGRMGSGQEIETTYFESTGLANELAQQTGLDTDVAAQSLQQLFGMFGQQLSGGQPAQEKKGLDSLLDEWEE